VEERGTRHSRSAPLLMLFSRCRVDDGTHLRDAVCREPSALGVLPDDVLVGRSVASSINGLTRNSCCKPLTDIASNGLHARKVAKWHEADQSCISVFEQKADLYFTRSISLVVTLTMVAER
jgi:hypothetical protein